MRRTVLNRAAGAALSRRDPQFSYQSYVSSMSSHRDRLRTLSESLRKGYPLADRHTDRQFEDLLRELARVPVKPPRTPPDEGA